MQELSLDQARLITEWHPGATSLWAGDEIQAASPRYCDLMQRTLGELRSEDWRDRVHPEDLEDALAATRLFLARGHGEGAHRHTTPGGGVSRLRTTSVGVFKDGRMVGALTSIERLHSASLETSPPVVQPQGVSASVGTSWASGQR